MKTDVVDNLAFIVGKSISKETACDVLIEELIELAHAVMKVKRLESQDNPCGIDQDEVFEKVAEEYNDVLTAILVYKKVYPEQLVYSNVCIKGKLRRWLKRIIDNGASLADQINAIMENDKEEP